MTSTETTNEFFSRAMAHNLKPNIINESSKFVVVTYWWGRGNLNKNMQRPCPEELKAGQELSSPPVLYEKMIERWEGACKKYKCNFLAEEYPEFAVKGGYQHAINFKPYFIDLALKACSPRGVLYIDGDMLIKLYPGICDMEDIDYMARGWNTDPRAGNWKKSGKFCFDPYVFEMSGGTMFFGDTPHGRNLLEFWKKETAKHPGKADDRILSMAIMKNKLLLPLTTVQLPLEYLWLDMEWDDYLDEGSDYKKNKISISHPECLTGEDRAASDGAATNRYPKGYDKAVESLINCDWDEIYEFVFFDDKKQIGPFRPYFDFLEEHGVADLYKFKDKYGPYNKVAVQNLKLLQTISLTNTDSTVVVSPHQFGTPSLVKIEDARMYIPTILKYLINGQSVLFIPGKPTSVRWVVEKAKKEYLEFVTRNKSKSKGRSKQGYLLELDHTYPIFFSAKSRVLKHLLMMSESFPELQKVFNRTYIFLTRIRCGWL